MDLILMKSRSKVVLASPLGTGTKPGPFSKIANVVLKALLVHGNALISVVFFLVAYATEECCSDPATGNHSDMELALSKKSSVLLSPAEVPQVRVVVADSALIQAQLLTRALRARRNFQVSTVALDVSALHQFMQSNPSDVVLLAGNQAINFGLLRWLHVSYPATAPVLLVDNYDRELVVNAFRSGVRSIFPFMHAPFRMLCNALTASPPDRSG